MKLSLFKLFTNGGPRKIRIYSHLLTLTKCQLIVKVERTTTAVLYMDTVKKKKKNVMYGSKRKENKYYIRSLLNVTLIYTHKRYQINSQQFKRLRRTFLCVGNKLL